MSCDVTLCLTGVDSKSRNVFNLCSVHILLKLLGYLRDMMESVISENIEIFSPQIWWIHRPQKLQHRLSADSSWLFSVEIENIIDFNCRRAWASLTIKHSLKFQIRFVEKFFWSRRAHDETQFGPSTSVSDEVFMSLSLMKMDQCITYLRLDIGSKKEKSETALLIKALKNHKDLRKSFFLHYIPSCFNNNDIISDL